MLCCPAMLALMMCEFANSWGLYVLVTEGPTFFWEVLGFDIYKVTYNYNTRIKWKVVHFIHAFLNR